MPEPLHRPVCHFLPPANWMNDPNGLIQWKGAYHLFYQHNPRAAVWGNMTWGHATSTDLVHWRHLPHALHPDQPYDHAGVFSGCAVEDAGTLTLLYTGVRKDAGQTVQTQCLATSSDDGTSFTKHPANPVLPAPPPAFQPRHFRDPFVWRERGAWWMALCASTEDQCGAVLLYQGQDLAHWRCAGTLLRHETADLGVTCECPNFLPLGGRRVLIHSPQPTDQAFYLSGDLVWETDRPTFTPGPRRVVDAGGCFYAPQAFRDERERWVMFGWLREDRPVAAQVRAGWSGVMSLPRVLGLAGDGRLTQTPAPELAALRGEALPPASAAGPALEIELEIDAADAADAGVAVQRTPDGAEETVVRYDAPTRRVVVDRSRSSLDPLVARDVREAEVQPDERGRVGLRIFVDHSVLEVFAHDGTAMAVRVYPTRPDATGLALGRGVRHVAVWALDPIRC